MEILTGRTRGEEGLPLHRKRELFMTSFALGFCGVRNRRRILWDIHPPPAPGVHVLYSH